MGRRRPPPAIRRRKRGSTLTTYKWEEWLRHLDHCDACKQAMRPVFFTAVTPNTVERPSHMCKHGWQLRQAAVREKAKMSQPYPDWLDKKAS